VKVDSGIATMEEAVTTAKRAEALGYDGAWGAEINSDPFLTLALAASATEDIQLGTSIAVAFSRSPMSLAYTANDLQRYSRGRLLLGLGSQVKAHVTRRFSMPWGKPAPQMREFILAMRAAWESWSEGTPLQFEGEYYRHTLMTPMFVPAPHPYGPPKVLLAGVGDFMTRIAGEVADGFLCHGFSTARWVREHTVPALEEGRRRAGKTMDGFEVIGPAFVATGTDEEIEAGVAQLKSQIAFYGSTPAYRPVLDLHGWGDLGEQLTVLSKQGRWSDMAGLIDEEVVDAFGVVAPIDEVPKHLAERFGGVVTRMSFFPPPSVDADHAAEVLAALRAIPSPNAPP
jgi:probable F420-dependent oxidoreductase